MHLARSNYKEAKVGTELRGLFGHGQSSNEGSHSSQQSSTSSESLLARASRLCKQPRPGKSIHSHKKGSKPYQRTPVSKKSLYQKLPEVLPQCKYEKISDMCIRCRLDMTEDERNSERKISYVIALF